MTFGSFFRSIGQSISHAAVGIYHAAGTAIDKVAGAGKYIIDRGVSLVGTVSHDASTTIGTVAHEAGGAIKSAGSSLAMPLAIGAAAIGAMFIFKQR